jgi:hypothetical protein
MLDATDQLQHLPELAHFTHADGKVLRRLVHHLSQADIDAGETVVWPSASYVATLGCLSDRQVRISLRRLAGAGLIEIRHRGRRRTPLISLRGFMERVGDVIEAGRGAITLMRKAEEISADDGKIFRTTETVQRTSQSVNTAASRSRLKTAPATPSHTHISTTTLTTNSSSDTTAGICPPTRARRSAGGSSAPLVDDLHVLLARSRTGQLLAGTDDLIHLDRLEARAAEHFESTIGAARHPGRIWTWALDRHGPAETVTAWILACDSPEITSPGAWFMGWVATPQRWDLTPNVARLLARSPEPVTSPRIDYSEAPRARVEDLVEDLERLAARIEAETAPAIPPAPSGVSATPPTLSEAGEAWKHFLEAWTAERGEALRASWLDGSHCLGIDGDRRLHVVVKSAFARDWLASRCVDTNRLAAAAAGAAGVVFVQHGGPQSRG